ncbi:MAG TPA: sugar ABC transporter ATP-binding protein [Pseudonocardiaceae bacterium]|jgi:ABC-type sugar transport system ATPase subunit|nr:sugar ABC transporter ATP-binding protein [Pseudonocardiaceae bacterium]
MTEVLRASGLVKRYGGVTALAGTDLTLRSAEVHALVGENGAGKSTLVKILSGVLRPDGGTVELDGRPTSFASARDAAAHGVAIVSQELSLFPDLTVLENLFPHNAPLRGGLLSPGRMAQRAAPVLRELGLTVPVRTKVGDLALADQQLVEIGRALLQHPRALILDEPTSALPRESVRRLDAVLRRLVTRGIAVLYISHFLEEVLRLAQRVTVLRDGRVTVSDAPTDSIDLDSLVTAMLGAAAPPVLGAAAPPAAVRTRTGRPGAAPAVSFDRVSVPDRLREVSFAVAPGEIVGFAGLQGAGHLSVFDVLCGRARPGSGVARINGRPAPRSFRHAIRAGVALVSSDRKRYGLMLDKPVWQNTSAVSWLGLGRGGPWLHRARLADTAAAHGRRLRIRGHPGDLTNTLSGGNQQKVVLAKWLDTEPSVIVLDDPTRGIDVGARAEMHTIIADLARDGRAVLIASTDLIELAELCDRVVIFQHGRVTDEIPADRLSEQTLSVAMNAGFAGTVE